ncbi:MAG TPA: hypothetical protein VHA07_13325 [Devosia sp.]|nr:hypothetical protein [Devosia sp.]
MTSQNTDHRAFALRLEQRVFSEPAETDPDLRRRMGERAAGGSPIAAPYDALAHQIGEAAYRVSDAQVAAVRDMVGTDRKAFELIVSAAIGAGLRRWKAGIAAIEGAAE